VFSFLQIFSPKVTLICDQILINVGANYPVTYKVECTNKD